MTHPLDTVFMTQIARPGLSGDGMDVAEYAALRADMNTMLARPAIHQLLDIPDVNGAPVDGDTLVYDAATNEWSPAAIPNGIRVSPDAEDDPWPGVNLMIFTGGLSAVRSSLYPNIVTVVPNVTGSGTSYAMARVDHTHAIRLPARVPFPATGSHSAGTRSLTTQTISGFDPSRTYNVWGELRGDLRGEGTGAGYSRPRITLTDASAHGQNRFGDVRTVAGVDREFGMVHQGIQFTGRSSITVEATLQFQPGDPMYVGAGELVIYIESNR